MKDSISSRTIGSQAKGSSPGPLGHVRKMQPVVLYGLALGGLVFLLKWLQWKFLVADGTQDVYIGLIAVFFTALGVWLATQLSKPQFGTAMSGNSAGTRELDESAVDSEELHKLGLTDREYEVLQLIAEGLSNAEVADRLCLSLSTIKTHVSKLYVKMDVKRRTQAIDKARRLKLVA